MNLAGELNDNRERFLLFLAIVIVVMQFYVQHVFTNRTEDTGNKHVRAK